MQISQNQGRISCQFSMKYTITFSSIWICLGANGPGVKDQEDKVHVSTTFSEVLN